jgi:hypothetical protein
MANLSRQQMCDRTDININSLKGWEIGRYGGLTTQGAEKIIHRVTQEGVQCTLDWLMYGIGAGPSVQADFNKIRPEPPLLPISKEKPKVEDEKIANEILIFKRHYAHPIDFIVDDDGMALLYNPGEYVAGNSLFANHINKAIGLDCIVQLEDGKIMLRRLRKGTKIDTYTLICINTLAQVEKPILYDVKIISAAPVIFHRRKNPII